jgi:hypothetical protein
VRSRRAGFSVVEIALATAVFGGGALAVIALLGALVGRAGEAREMDEVRVLSDAVRVAVRIQAQREGVAAFGAGLPVWGDSAGSGRILPIAVPGGHRVEVWRLPVAGLGSSDALLIRVRVTGAGFSSAYGFTVGMAPE